MYDGNKSALAPCSDGRVAFDVAINSNVLYVETTMTRGRHSADDAIMAALEAHAVEMDAVEVQEGTLLHFHQRLSHLAFDTIERMARDPTSGIRLTSNKRMTCVSCLEGRQTRNAQPQVIAAPTLTSTESAAPTLLSTGLAAPSAQTSSNR